MPGSERHRVERASLQLEPVPCVERASNTNHTDEAVEGPPEETRSTIALWVRGHARRIGTRPPSLSYVADLADKGSEARAHSRTLAQATQVSLVRWLLEHLAVIRGR